MAFHPKVLAKLIHSLPTALASASISMEKYLPPEQYPTYSVNSAKEPFMLSTLTAEVILTLQEGHEGQLDLAGGSPEDVGSDEEVEPRGLRNNQCSLRKDASGMLKAPVFVYAGAARIFITGKSVVFLERLLEHDIPISTLPLQLQPVSGADINLSMVCRNGQYLAPFWDIFATAFDKWINDCHHSVSSRLRDFLY
ncbi:hypothetical protein HOY82DRAFT_625778 [Tuber indicum]|nr:hypothetical protein HOY82DRAFT_625778 [Tuber indicum]